MESVDTLPAASFAALGLNEGLVHTLADLEYETPTPIQAASIPVLLSGADLLGQAQTGTGKTAAFALPLLSQLELERRVPQALVLVPTRELAIQVAAAIEKYAVNMRGLRVLAIYGGQSYTPQLDALKRGVQVIVGTPGRIMDHLERGTLALDAVRFVVLDEADEMLQMGFVDAIETILSRTPLEKQVALFSATLPAPIRHISQRHLRSPRTVTIQSKTTTAANIHQRYWLVSGMHKLDALTRILEVESFDAMLVFVRTKQSSLELAERLLARGFAAAALNGDLQQSQRDRTIAQLKSGAIDILVATDVAARGLDVERIGHVVNFDVPHDTESYVHRIGRTGRAGRSGEAILFIAPRERSMLHAIERATRQPIEAMTLPTVDDVNARRIDRFKARVAAALSSGAATDYRAVIEAFAGESGADMLDVAAALASLAQGKTPLILSASPAAEQPRPAAADCGEHGRRNERSDQPRARKGVRKGSHFGPQETYRLEVGRAHGVLAGNIVGAIANEADLHGSQINGIDIQEDHTFVRLPAGMPPAVLSRLQRVRIKGRELAAATVARRPAAGQRRSKPQRAAAR